MRHQPSGPQTAAPQWRLTAYPTSHTLKSGDAMRIQAGEAALSGVPRDLTGTLVATVPA